MSGIHTIFLIGEIDEAMSTRVLRELREIDGIDKNADIEVVINSQGGHVVEGLAIYSDLAAMSLRGGGTHHITTRIRGVAGSMATVVFQVGDHRVMGEYDLMIYHEASYGSDRDYVTTTRRDLEQWAEQDDMLVSLIVKRTGDTSETRHDEIVALHKQLDTLCYSHEALKLGLIDEIDGVTS